MPYLVTDLRQHVRDTLQNISSTTFADAKLDTILAQGKRALDKDKPNVVTYQLAGTGKKTYALTGVLTGWTNQFSTIETIENPMAIVANDDNVQFEDPKNIRIFEQNDIEYLRIESGISSGKSALVRYSIPWKLSGLLGDSTTTIPTKLINALEFICVSFTAMSLSAKSAGQLDDQIEGDLINWSSKQSSYKFVAKDFEEQYYRELAIDRGKLKPAILRADYDRDPRRIGYLTH